MLKFMHRTGQSQTDLAKSLNKTDSYISKVTKVNAKSPSSVSYSVMLELVELGLNADELLGEALGEKFRKRCHEEYVTKNNIAIGVNNKTVVDGIKTVINGLNIILKQCDKDSRKQEINNEQ